MVKKSTLLFVFVLIICSINFFDYQNINGSFVKYLQGGYLLFAITIALPYIFPKNNGFVLPVQLIFFSIFLSIFISWVTWGQSLSDGLAGSTLSLIWVVFFYLQHIKFPVEKIEKIIVIYGIIYLILYFFQFTHADKNYFIDVDTVDDGRGISRIVFPGRGVFYLTTFIAINKLTVEKEKRWFWALLTIMGIVVTVMQVTRQFIFGILIIYVFHFLKDQNIYKKVIVGLCVFGIVFYIYQSNNVLVKGLKDTQDQTNDQGLDYIRIQAATFFLTKFSHSPINRILGNGVPYGKTSDYFKYTTKYSENYGFWLSDVGLIGVYAMFGIFAVLGYILLWIKSFIIKLPKEYYYLKYYLWFLLFTCLTSDTIYSKYDLIATILVIYSYQVIYEREKFRLLIAERFKAFNSTNNILNH